MLIRHRFLLLLIMAGTNLDDPRPGGSTSLPKSGTLCCRRCRCGWIARCGCQKATLDLRPLLLHGLPDEQDNSHLLGCDLNRQELYHPHNRLHGQGFGQGIVGLGRPSRLFAAAPAGLGCPALESCSASLMHSSHSQASSPSRPLPSQLPTLPASD